MTDDGHGDDDSPDMDDPFAPIRENDVVRRGVNNDDCYGRVVRSLVDREYPDPADLAALRGESDNDEEGEA